MTIRDEIGAFRKTWKEINWVDKGVFLAAAISGATFVGTCIGITGDIRHSLEQQKVARANTAQRPAGNTRYAMPEIKPPQ